MDKPNIAIIGAGAWGFNHVRTFAALEECTLSHVSDSSSAVLKKIKKHFPSIKITENPDEIFHESSIDAIVVASPASTHYELARKSLETGKDVLVEKPLTIDVKEAESLLEIAEKRKLIGMVGHLLLYHPAIDYLKQLISRGDLGNLYYLYSRRLNLGKIRSNEDAIWSFAPHDISMMLYLTDSFPISVSANGKAFIQNEIIDLGFFYLEFPNKVVGQGHVSWLDPHKVRLLTVVGSKKMVVFDDTESGEKIRIYDKGIDFSYNYDSYGEAINIRSGDLYIPKINPAEPLKIEALHFIKCIKDRSKPLSDFNSGVKVVRILNALSISVKKKGEPISIKDLI
ncbi:MAG: Gfo/Idh/MocA family oxidoreductase [Candidatus Coatesbacteria bacterium]|nr:Gfo/Idh/MocA family oxidoreductase [Candidatus Coatesbacteria bacterium]